MKRAHEVIKSATGEALPDGNMVLGGAYISNQSVVNRGGDMRIDGSFPPSVSRVQCMIP
jgi:hypothetical protein